MVAEKFADISLHRQIIAVSHLAQIVSTADTNFLISKHETDDGKTLTDIEKLSGEKLRGELIRLIGGTEQSSAAAKLADELRSEALAYKTEHRSR